MDKKFYLIQEDKVQGKYTHTLSDKEWKEESHRQGLVYNYMDFAYCFSRNIKVDQSKMLLRIL